MADIKEIFAEALELPPERRPPFLDDRCGGDQELRAAVERLLSLHEEAGRFLAGPTMLTSGTTTPPPPSQQTTHPQRIGGYKLIEPIGEGGFGTVYLAEQQSPVRRRVALKVIKLGMDTAQVIARFEAERQALAMMDHPNIAKVFDAGATETGRPYFVMELVSGVPATQYCDANRLMPRQRLELFIAICQAVQHAHQKGIIHRDLKPSNVLVTLQDGRAIPKIIDFGIAKATQSRLTERSVFTELRQMIGTPEYMSPEQAQTSALDVDTRSDVYSLGVLLYELLTGATPFDPKELRSRAFDEIQRVIREVDPPNPSTRLSKLATLANVAAQRNIEPAKLSSMVRGELDWIVMKCLEKERARRYDSAAALAADVMHYLADEPVAAAAPSRTYRFRKFVRRNKGPVIASTALIAMLLAGITGTTIGLIGQSRQRRIAENQRAVAENQRAIADAVSQFQSEMLASADPEKLLGNKVTVLQAVQAAVRELDAGKLRDQPLVEASVRETIGNTLRALGSYDEAEPNLRKALELRRAAMAPDDPSIATSLNQLAWLMEDRGQYAQAEPLLRQSLQIRRIKLPARHPDIAEILNNLAVTLKRQGKYAEAEAAYRESLAIIQNTPDRDRDVAQGMNNLAMLLLLENKPAEAEPLLRGALLMRRKALPPEHPDIAESLNNLGRLLQVQGKAADAELTYRQSLDMFRKVFPAGHPKIAQCDQILAELLRLQGRLDEAEGLFRESLQMYRNSLPPAHPYIGTGLNNLALVLRAQGKLAEAESMFREALEIRRQSLPPGHLDIALGLYNLASVLREERQFALAEPLYRESIAVYRSHFGNDHVQIGMNRLGLGISLSKMNRPAESETELLDAERVLAAAGDVGPAPPNHRICLEALAALYTDWEKAEPGKGYGDKAQHWNSRIPSTGPATLPAILP